MLRWVWEIYGTYTSKMDTKGTKETNGNIFEWPLSSSGMIQADDDEDWPRTVYKKKNAAIF